MAAVAHGRAKELLEVGGRPLLAHAFSDLSASGLGQALIVTSPLKPELAATFGPRFGSLELSYVEQPEPRGLLDAIELAVRSVADLPILVWLPDNHWRGTRPAAAQLLAALESIPSALMRDRLVTLVALVEIDRSQVGRFGGAGFVETAEVRGHPDLVEIERVYAKGERSPQHGARLLKGFPFHLHSSAARLLAEITAQRTAHESGPGPARELDDTPLLQLLAREHRLFGVILRDGALYDCGIPAGFAAASAAAQSA